MGIGWQNFHEAIDIHHPDRHFCAGPKYGVSVLKMQGSPHSHHLPFPII
jgi:hypothetical protein